MAEHDDVVLRIIHAVARRRMLRLRYHFYSRVVEPYAIGRARDGRTVLVAWQVSGSSESGPARGWHTFDLEDIIGLAELPDPFVPRLGPLADRSQAADARPRISRA